MRVPPPSEVIARSTSKLAKPGISTAVAKLPAQKSATAYAATRRASTRQLSTGGFRYDSREVRFGGVQIYTETNNATTHQTGVAWENAFTFIVPGEMREAGRVNGQRWHETVVAFHGAREFSSRVPPMSLRAVSVAQSLALSCWEVARTVDFASRLTRNIKLVGKRESTRMAAGQITELVSLCVERPDVLALAPARAAFTRELLDLLSPFVSDDDESGVPVGDSRRRIQIVRRAREFALEHIDTPLRVSDVCQAVGISRRTLQYSFELELGINPVAYLRLMRLNGARRDLLFPCPEWQVKAGRERSPIRPASKVRKQRALRSRNLTHQCEQPEPHGPWYSHLGLPKTPHDGLYSAAGSQNLGFRAS